MTFGHRIRALNLHVNPLRPRILMAVNNTTGKVREKVETMSWRDAAIVASVLSAASFFTVFLTGLPFEAIASNPGLCVYNAVVYVGKEWFTLFIGLAGLGKIAQGISQGEKAETSPGAPAKTTSEG